MGSAVNRGKPSTEKSMNTKPTLKLGMALLFLSTLHAQLSPALAQGTAFTYQGRLNDGSAPANGRFDFGFALCTSASGPTINANVIIYDVSVTNGLFTTLIDFGPNFFDGRAFWLEIGVRTNDMGGPFAVLQPRQPITPTPSAQYAALAGTVTNGAITASQLNVNSVGKEALQPDAVTSAKIADGSITPADVNPATFSTTFWKVDGNAGTTTTNFLGTTDNWPLELRVGGARALRLEPIPHVTGSYSNVVNVIGGSSANFVAPGVRGATIGGGGAANYFGNSSNSVSADFGTVSGGLQNSVKSLASGIGGGILNVIQSDAGVSAIGGGSNNIVQLRSDGSVIAGGRNNLIQSNSVEATISGGNLNTIGTNAGAATIAGGFVNTIHDGAGSSTISGGNLNTNEANSVYSTIGGGLRNRTMGTAATLGGGSDNTSSGAYATVGGGGANTTVAYGATVGGGVQNTASGTYATVPGGNVNIASGVSSLAGGRFSTASGIAATVPGGSANVASGDASLAAGSFSTASGLISTALGEGNLASGRASIAIGSFTAATEEFTMAAGRKAKANHPGSFVWADSTDADFESTVNDQFSIRANGGVRMVGAGLFSMGAENGVVGGSANSIGSGVYGVNSGQGRGVTGRATGIGSAIYGENPEPSGWAGNFDGNVFVRLNQSFGAQTRQMLNLWETRYGIGVQPGTLYFRADNFTTSGGFAWFKGGSHVDAVKDPGPGGELLMSLDNNGLTVFRGVKWSVGGALVDNQGGSIELGPQFSTTATTPFIDFHYSSGVINIEDYNVRLINDANRRLTLDGNLNVTGTISPPSDRNVKAGFEAVDTKSFLERVVALPITRWHYTNDLEAAHVGPVAQDFHAAFGLGSDDKHIATVDADGVALAAIQGLNQKLEEKLQQKETEIMELKQAVTELKGLVSKLAGQNTR
jgi:hypothetical protein